MLTFFGSSNINRFVSDYLQQQDDLTGKVAVDIPAGSGVMSEILQERGATVKAFDLFPEVFKVEGLTCEAADLQERIPMPDHSADIVLCQEGIEHLPNQLAALQEMNRILKPGGLLILTTPSISNLRSRLSNFLTESELYKRLPPNELDAIWSSAEGRTYFGHIFLIGIQRLRVLAVASGFQLKSIQNVRVSATSLLLGIFYPVILLVNLFAYRRNLTKKDDLPQEEKRRVYGEILKINLHPTILFGRHLFLEFQKEKDTETVDIYVNKRDF